MHLLLIEDEPKLTRYICQALQKGGCTVDRAGDGPSGLQRALEARHDAVVLDLTLPGCDGLEVLRELRVRQNTVPVLVLSARGTPAERVEGLELGADDYLAKPFVMEELIARLRSLKRRATTPPAPPLSAGDLTFNPTTKLATRGGEKLDLSARESGLLEYLLRHPNRVISRVELQQRVWGYEFEPGTNVVAVTVGRLRRKVDEGRDPVLIHTVPWQGYTLRTL
jgi:two-component system copper resistance phosphate regulon response regulator CusR